MPTHPKKTATFAIFICVQQEDDNYSVNWVLLIKSSLLYICCFGKKRERGKQSYLRCKHQPAPPPPPLFVRAHVLSNSYQHFQSQPGGCLYCISSAERRNCKPSGGGGAVYFSLCKCDRDDFPSSPPSKKDPPNCF